MAFDIDETIQSQYAAAPKITYLIRGFGRLIAPEADFRLMYRSLIDPDTAAGVGLDVWGRIVAMDRLMEGVETADRFFGFNPPNGARNDNLDTPDHAPFVYRSVGDAALLSDNAYRMLIKTKAMANISTGTLADLNRLMHMLLPDKALYIVRIEAMHLRIVVHDYLSGFETNLLMRGDLPPLPVGVGWDLYRIDPHTFGFNGSGLEPLNQGVYSLGSPVPADYTKN